MQDQNISVPSRQDVWFGRIEDWKTSGQSSVHIDASKIDAQKLASAKFVAGRITQASACPSLLLEHRSGNLLPKNEVRQMIKLGKFQDIWRK